MTDRESQLEHIVEAQAKALNHWRQQADLDYAQIQRLYYALLEVGSFLDSGDRSKLAESVFGKIQQALDGVRLVPPKVFQ